MKLCRLLVSSQEPILPISLLEANQSAISKSKRREAKANAKFMHRIPDTEFIKTPTYKVLTLTRKSRPTTRFVNVGSAFMNARELAKRKVVSQHKSRLRARRNLEKKKIMFSPDYFYLSQRKSRIRARRKLKKPPKE
jgi:hypothetical protein